MEQISEIVGSYVATLLAERWPEFMVVALLIYAWRWLTSRSLRDEIAKIKRERETPKAALTTINHFHGDIGTFIQGDDGLHRAHFSGHGEIVSSEPVRVHYVHVNERLTISDDVEVALSSEEQADAEFQEGWDEAGRDSPRIKPWGH